MLALATLLFLLVLVIEVIRWIGKSVLSNAAFAMYAYIARSDAVKRQRELKRTILQDQTQLKQTSAQDQFAKWAKLRRKVDKGLADLEAMNSEIAAARSSFELKFNTLLWIATTGVQYAVGWWYSKQAVFYLPKGWFGPLEWWLSLPFAPRGSVSVGVWQMACRRTILFAERVVKDLILDPYLNQVPQKPAASSEKSLPKASG